MPKSQKGEKKTFLRSPGLTKHVFDKLKLNILLQSKDELKKKEPPTQCGEI